MSLWSLGAGQTAFGIDFRPQVSYELAGSEPSSITTGQFNLAQDSHIDLAAAMSGGGEISVVLGDGSGGFAEQAGFRILFKPTGIAAADFNSDNHTDLAVTAIKALDGTQSRNVFIYLNDGTGNFSELGKTPAVAVEPRIVATGHFNADKLPDMVVAAGAGNNDVLSLHLAVAAGVFNDGVLVPGSLRATKGEVLVADLNNDSHDDIVSGAAAFIGDGSGGFTRSANLAIGLKAVGDFNMDAVVDVVTVSGNAVHLQLGNGDGTFRFGSSVTLGPGVQLVDVAATDFDNDGVSDVVTADIANDSVVVLSGNCDGTLSSPKVFSAGLEPVALALGDWNKDGFDDIAAAYRNSGQSPFLAVLLQTPSTTPPITAQGRLQFATATPHVSEGTGSAGINIDRVCGSNGAISVEYATVNGGTATVGADYVATSGTLEFANNVTRQTFNVPILDNTRYEGDKTVKLKLNGVKGGATLGFPEMAVLTIQDDDTAPQPGVVSFESASYSVAENKPRVTLGVSRRSGSSGSIAVNYTTIPHTASADLDYKTAAGVLEFADGVTNRSLVINIQDDTLYEGNETLNIALSKVSGGALLGNPRSAVLTIQEDDAPPTAGSVQFGDSAYSIDENVDTIRIAVTRIGGTAGMITVDFSTEDGTAVAGEDYEMTSGTIFFDNGQSLAEIVIPVFDDLDYEKNETLKVTLSNPTPTATLGQPQTVEVTIIENDTQAAQNSAGPGTTGSGGCSIQTAGDTDPMFPLLVLFLILFRYRRQFIVFTE